MGDHQDDAEYGLVMPFVVCEDQGGPYKADAFVAGVWYGQIDSVLKLGGLWSGYVPSPLVPQLDLLAMHYGRTMTAVPWDEHPEDHTLVTFGVPEGDA